MLRQASTALGLTLRPMLRRPMTTAAATPIPDAPPPATEVLAYTKATAWLHWLMAGGILGCIGTVQGAMRTKDKEMKGQLMTLHKSFGLSVGLLVPARLALLFMAKRPGGVIGAAAWEHFLANVSHYVLYALLIVMPGTGIAMGYYGGKGLPFFGYTIPGAPKPNGGIAKNAFMVHKRAGVALEVMVPLHVAGAGMHYVRGHTIFGRINPFA